MEIHQIIGRLLPSGLMEEWPRLTCVHSSKKKRHDLRRLAECDDGAHRRGPAGRVGRLDDLAQGDPLAMTNGFMTGTIIDIEGGGLL
ncbi:hypothetical protein [Ralstonia syzygii]|nr:hypothetical protein [Ralstonia syzygii]